MTYFQRTIVAFVLAPAVVAVGVGLFIQPSRPVGVILFALPVAYAHAIILGIPTFLWCRRKTWFGTVTVLMGAFLIGALPVGVWLMCFAPGVDYYRAGPTVLSEHGRLTAAGIWANVQLVLIGGGLGFIGGFIWRLISGKPDKG